MIVVMKSSATPEQVDHVCGLIREMGLKDHPIQGSDLTVVAAIGDERQVDGDVLERAPGVSHAMHVQKPYQLASREGRDATSQVVVGGGQKGVTPCTFGGVEVPVIAGPCSVEGEEAILVAARAAKAAGAHALRGGAFKPRTNPYAFQGHGEDGLKMLAAARDETGLPVFTEVLTPSDVELVSKYADCLQIGTRNSQNFKLLEAAGRQPKPVLMKRGMSMTLDEYLQACEYILAEGNDRVILCERGIRTFEDHTRNTLSLSVVPELHERTHLPVVIDPSHGTGKAHLVPAMAKAAIAAGCDGLAIEMHVDPEHALTDGAQSVTPAVLTSLMADLARVAVAVDRTCVAGA